MNSIDAARLDKAIIFATNAHAGAMRKGGGLPYIVHPLEALGAVIHLTDDIDVLCATVLHDVVEDTQFTLEDIKVGFGERVAELVAHVSENKRRDLPAQDTWKIRKEEAIESHRDAPLEVKMILLCDKLSNLRGSYQDFLKDGDAIWEKFNMKDKSQHEWYYRAIADICAVLKDTPAYEEYEALLGRLFR